MMYLTKNTIIMNAKVDNKESALKQVATALTQAGLVDDNYLEALKLRELQANTYLGSGIAIPHGIPAYKSHITKTGVVLIHFEDGVDWGEGNQVYLVVGIAATTDEHLSILQSLTRTLWDDTAEARIKSATCADDIISILGGEQQKSHTNAIDTNHNVLTAWQLTDCDTVEHMLATGVASMTAKGWVSDGFLTAVLAAPVINLTKTVACVQASEGVCHLASLLIVGKDKAIALIALPSNKTVQAIDDTIERLLNLNINDTSAILQTFHEQVTTDSPYVSMGVAQAVSLTKPDNSVITDARYYIGHVFLVNRYGLHARPATYLSKLASEFEGDVWVSLDNKTFVSAKSLIRLLSLGASYGQQLTFAVSKTKEGQKQLDALIDAVNEGLGEEVEPIDAQKELTKENCTTESAKPKLDESDSCNSVLDKKSAPMMGEPIYGIGASSGIAIAPAFVVKNIAFDYPIKSNNATAEKQALHLAIEVATSDLQQVISRAKTREIAEIFAAHLGILSDEELINNVCIAIDTGLSAAMAWNNEIERIANEQSALDNARIAERADDFKDVGRRVLAVLCHQKTTLPLGEYVLVKEELLPSDVAMLDEQVVALVTAVGTASSHSVIIAKSLGIPALMGVGYEVLQVADGTDLLVNAADGYMVIRPDDELIDEQLAKQKALDCQLAHAKQMANTPAVTADGHLVHVMANLGDTAKAGVAVAQGAEGLGLLRTEFVFMKHNKMPDEDTQIADYAGVFEIMCNRPVVVRTLDVGGDKLLPYLAMNKEDNPFLGVRGIRLSLQRPELLFCQLSALLQAAQGKPLRIMFPMVGQIEEWRAAKAILDELLQTYPHTDLQVGIMIEVPSAAVMADVFAKEVDFFSIGTNDLTQYVLAIDRGHSMLSAAADGLHPSVLRLIDMTVKAAHAHGKWVGVCGELGADKIAVPILVGLGVDELSVSAAQIPLVKAQIRTLNMSNCQNLATLALNQNGSTAVRKLVMDSLLVEM